MGAPVACLGSRELKEAFFSKLSNLGIDPKLGRVQSGAIGSEYTGHRFGRVFLAGDAAGMASPLTGEGIAQAMISGKEVAREIVETGYRSSVLASLAVRHRRTAETLARLAAGKALLRLAPKLLRFSGVREATLDRYVI